VKLARYPLDDAPEQRKQFRQSLLALILWPARLTGPLSSTTARCAPASARTTWTRCLSRIGSVPGRWSRARPRTGWGALSGDGDRPP